MTTRLANATDFSPAHVFLHLSDAVVVADATRGQIVLWNPAAERLFGYSAVEAVAMLVDVLVPERLKSELRASVTAYLDTGGALGKSERLVRRKNGEEIWVELTLSRLETSDPHGRLVAAIMRETTAPKRAQPEYQGSESRFRALIEHAHDIITILAEDGTIQYESPAIERVLGFGQADLLGKNAFDFVHQDDRPATWQTFVDLLTRPGATAPTLFRFRHADGSWRWLEAVGYNLLADPAVGGVVVNSRDVTVRKAAEESPRPRADSICRIR